MPGNPVHLVASGKRLIAQGWMKQHKRESPEEEEVFPSRECIVLSSFLPALPALIPSRTDRDRTNFSVYPVHSSILMNINCDWFSVCTGTAHEFMHDPQVYKAMQRVHRVFLQTLFISMSRNPIWKSHIGKNIMYDKLNVYLRYILDINICYMRYTGGIYSAFGLRNIILEYNKCTQGYNKNILKIGARDGVI